MSIDVKNLYFSYDKAPVLVDVNFGTNAGEMLCVLGPNGVGKSTLFNCILGLFKPKSGQIILDEVDIKEYSARDLALKIAYVPQSHAPTFNYSVSDMVLMGTTAQVGRIQSPGAEEMKLVEAALERTGITHLKDRGYMQISGGERQLTLIARALAQQAKIVIMDEPTANLDYGNQLRILLRVKELVRSEKLTVIQSTHNPDHAFMFGDRVLALVGGRVEAIGPPEQAVTEALIQKLYGIKVKLCKSEDGYTYCRPIIGLS